MVGQLFIIWLLCTSQGPGRGLIIKVKYSLTFATRSMYFMYKLYETWSYLRILRYSFLLSDYPTGGGSLTGAVHSISQCMITLLHSAHHAHLAGAVREGPLWCSAEGSDSDDSVLI